MSYLNAKTQYLVTIHLPDNFDPSTVDPATEHDIDVLNDEMVAKGVRTFVGGLLPVATAKSLRAQPGPGGKVVVTDGPYLETKEHIGGFWVVEAASLEEALEWGRKAVIACRANVEVRQFGMPPTEGAQRRLKAAATASKKSKTIKKGKK
jgi:hypothetical protein